jgi:hypothetical protein
VPTRFGRDQRWSTGLDGTGFLEDWSGLEGRGRVPGREGTSLVGCDTFRKRPRLRGPGVLCPTRQRGLYRREPEEPRQAVHVDEVSVLLSSPGCLGCRCLTLPHFLKMALENGVPTLTRLFTASRISIGFSSRMRSHMAA